MTLSTSVIETRDRKSEFKTAFVYLLIALFCVLFGAVYEKFSHDVYSFSMIYAFVFPLVGGTLPFLLIAFSNVREHPRARARMTYHTGIALLTIGSILRGIMEIYGTANHLIKFYFIVGIPLLVIGALLIIARLKGPAGDRKKTRGSKQSKEREPQQETQQ